MKGQSGCGAAARRYSPRLPFRRPRCPWEFTNKPRGVAPRPYPARMRGPAAGIVTGTAKTTNSSVEFVGFGPPIVSDWRA